MAGSTGAAVVPEAEAAGVPNVNGLLVTAGLLSLSAVLAPKENLGALLVGAVVVVVAVVVVAELVLGEVKLKDEDEVAGAVVAADETGFVDPNVKLGVLVLVAVLAAVGVPKLKGDVVLEDAGVAVEVLGVSVGLLNENPPKEELVEVEGGAEAVGLVLPNVNGEEAVDAVLSEAAGLSEVAGVVVGVDPKVKDDELVVEAAVDVAAAGAAAGAAADVADPKVKGDALAVVVAPVDEGVTGADAAAGAPNENAEPGVVGLAGVLKLNADGPDEVLAVLEEGALNVKAVGVVAAGVLNEIADD